MKENIFCWIAKCQQILTSFSMSDCSVPKKNMHLGSCGACKMAWICDCAGGREEAIWWTRSVSRLHWFHGSFSEIILPLCLGYVLQFLSIWLRCVLRWVIPQTLESSWPIPICKCCSVPTICFIPRTTDAWRFYFRRVSAACAGKCDFINKNHLIMLHLRACGWSFGKRSFTLASTSKVPQVTCVHVSVISVHTHVCAIWLWVNA